MAFVPYDGEFFTLALNLENATQAELDNLMSGIKGIIAKYTRGGEITDAVAMSKEMDNLIEVYYEKFGENLRLTAYGVGDLAATAALTEVIPLLSKAGLYRDAIQLYNDVQGYALDVSKRIFNSNWAGRTLGFRIKTLQDGTQKTVQNLITNGVNQQKGARAIAKDIEQYINPVPDVATVSPADAYRVRFGRPKSYKVPGIPRGTVQYNSYRIARTETAHIYRQSSIDFYENRDWVKGFKWVLSNAHPKEDICNEWASVELYEDVAEIPLGHPHCLCRVRPVIMTPKEMRDLRFSYGDIGNPYRDAQGKFSNADKGTLLNGKTLTAEDKAIQDRLASRPANLRAIEQATSNMSDAQRLKLADGDIGQAGLQISKAKRDALLAKFRKAASGK